MLVNHYIAVSQEETHRELVKLVDSFVPGFSPSHAAVNRGLSTKYRIFLELVDVVVKGLAREREQTLESD